MCGFGGLFLRCGFKNAESTFKEIHTRWLDTFEKWWNNLGSSN
jgi:hypothetical protein